jgi:hypothetical protein
VRVLKEAVIVLRNRVKSILMIALALACCSLTAEAKEFDWRAVGKFLGKEGTVQPDGVYRIGLPRSDFYVTLDGVSLKPSFALGGWIAFEAVGDRAPQPHD